MSLRALPVLFTLVLSLSGCGHVAPPVAAPVRAATVESASIRFNPASYRPVGIDVARGAMWAREDSGALADGDQIKSHGTLVAHDQSSTSDPFGWRVFLYPTGATGEPIDLASKFFLLRPLGESWAAKRGAGGEVTIYFTYHKRDIPKGQYNVRRLDPEKVELPSGKIVGF